LILWACGEQCWIAKNAEDEDEDEEEEEEGGRGFLLGCECDL